MTLSQQFIDTVEKNTSGSVDATEAISPSRKHLVLIGGGHAHVQVIKALRSRPDHLRVTLIDVQEAASYSGMVPGCIAGLYEPSETQLHLQPLAEWAGITFLHAQVEDVDFKEKLIHLETANNLQHNDSPAAPSVVPFDVISLDIGSTTRDLYNIPGAVDYTIPTRPISDLVQRIKEAESRLVPCKEVCTRVVVIGGGVAGIELAMSLHGRWGKKTTLKTLILDAACHEGLLPGESDACRKKLLEILKDKNISIQFECGVQQIKKDCVILARGETVPFTHCIWATGAGAHELAWTLANKRGLKVSKHGWFKVTEYLQSISHPFVFAAGDCSDHPHKPPKAGVYAVRAGPVLIENLTSYLLNNETVTTKYEPQDDFLKLLACGDGTSLGFRFGIPIHGKWAWQMKDMIDNKFMDLFRVELLPGVKPGETYDTSQYDASYQKETALLDPAEAAQLLRRSDDDVAYQQALQVLRDMATKEMYREDVLKQWHAAELC